MCGQAQKSAMDSTINRDIRCSQWLSVRFCSSEVLQKEFLGATARMVRSKWIVACLLPLTLCGCLPEQKRQVFDCEYKYLNAPRIQPNLRTNAARDYVESCMAEHGYVRDFAERECQPKVELNAYCYAPKGNLAFLTYKAELLTEEQ